MADLDEDQKYTAAAELVADVREFAQRTPRWAEHVAYESKPDERLDPTLIARRVYGSRSDFLVVAAAAGLDSVERTLKEQTLILPTPRQLRTLKQNLGVASNTFERAGAAPSFIGHPGIRRGAPTNLLMFLGAIPNQNATIGVAFSFATSVYWSGGVQPLTWTIAAGTLPSGLTLNSATGLISGTPGVVQVASGLVLVATAANGIVSVSNAFSITVTGPSDPLFASVLLLANGAGLTVDSSSYNRTLVATGSMALSNTHPLNSNNTYVNGAAGEDAGLAVDLTAITTALANNESCVESWLKFLAPGTGPQANQILSTTGWHWLRYIHSDSDFAGFATMIDTTIKAAGIGSFTWGSGWRHVAWIRDNTTSATESFMRLGIDGTIVASSAGFSKTLNLNIVNILARFMGADTLSVRFAWGGFRVTNTSRRYLTNAQGAALNTYTPDQYPFLAS